MIVPGTELEVCDQCGETTISLESSLKVEAYVAEQIELLSTTELGTIRIGFDVDQTEMSEILGLGEKTYHRWEKGNQIPSRSMGFYLRILQHFPDTFEWLRKREWRQKDNAKIITVDFKKSFPALVNAECYIGPNSQRHNPAKALFGRIA